MTVLALYDIETNGLLEPKRDKNQIITEPALDRVWSLCIRFRDLTTGATRNISACDQPGFHKGMRHYYMPGLGTVPKVLVPGETPPEGAVVWERLPLVDAYRLLEQADLRVAHNGQDFDERASRKVYPWWTPKPKSKLLDTLILSRLIYPDIHKNGPNGHKLFPHEKRSHGVEAWGKRLGRFKGDYSQWCKEQGLDPWSQWRPEMQWYCDEDVEVLDTIFKWLWAQKPATTATEIEHEFAAIIRRLESWGWAFDRDKAEDLHSELQIKEAQLETTLIKAFGSFYMPVRRGKADPGLKASWKEEEEDEDAEDAAVQATRYQQFLKDQADAYMVIPTRSYKVKKVGGPVVTLPRFSPKTGKRIKDYVGPVQTEITMGHPYTPVKLVEFNPSSRAHIWQRLMAKYGWVPSKFTPGGKNKAPEPVVDEEVLRGLPYPEADLLAEYFLVLKRIGQLATGAKAWLKFARETEQPNGSRTYRIHGRINTNGAATGRCTHSNPNLAQVPKNTAAEKDYPDSPELHGTRCRELFIAAPGKLLAGFDGAALELRMLAHFLHPWDKGEYADLVHNGDKAKGTDPHSWLCYLIGEDLLGPIHGGGRDNAKTVMYAELYGAGQLKIGSIVMPKGDDKEKTELGRQIKAKMGDRFVAKTELQKALAEEVETKKRLVGLDGRTLFVRKPHAALNTLLQSAGAVVMKKALIVLDRDLQSMGLRPGREYEFVGNIHDEAQAEIDPSIQETYRKSALASMPKAGEALRLRCPLEAEVSIGLSWRDTH